MKLVGLGIAVAAVVFTSSGICQANTVSLSSPDDLSGLVVGKPARIRISLSGLGAGEELVTLTGSVVYPGGLLGGPTLIVAGPIIPNPLADPLDFGTFGASGQADAFFLTFGDQSIHHISSNGVFYEFDVTAMAPGSGQISFMPLALVAEQFDPLHPQNPILLTVDAGPPLEFTIQAQDGAGVPEPLTLVAIPAGLAAIGSYLARRRRILGGII